MNDGFIDLVQGKLRTKLVSRNTRLTVQITRIVKDYCYTGHLLPTVLVGIFSVLLLSPVMLTPHRMFTVYLVDFPNTLTCL